MTTSMCVWCECCSVQWPNYTMTTRMCVWCECCSVQWPNYMMTTSMCVWCECCSIQWPNYMTITSMCVWCECCSVQWPKGLCKEFCSPNIREYYGSGWVSPGLTLNFLGKSSQNSSKPVLIFWSSIPYVFCLYMH